LLPDAQRANEQLGVVIPSSSGLWLLRGACATPPDRAPS
jgi:hypothetical protein